MCEHYVFLMNVSVVCSHVQGKVVEVFVHWLSSRRRMAFSRGRALKRRTSPARGPLPVAGEGRRAEDSRVRPDFEQRSKILNDRPSVSTGKDKGKIMHRTPLSKMRKLADIPVSDSSAENGAEEDPDWRYVSAVLQCRFVMSTSVQLVLEM